jgi:hypothetical protein
MLQYETAVVGLIQRCSRGIGKSQIGAQKHVSGTNYVNPPALAPLARRGTRPSTPLHMYIQLAAERHV